MKSSSYFNFSFSGHTLILAGFNGLWIRRKHPKELLISVYFYVLTSSHIMACVFTYKQLNSAWERSIKIILFHLKVVQFDVRISVYWLYWRRFSSQITTQKENRADSNQVSIQARRLEIIFSDKSSFQHNFRTAFGALSRGAVQSCWCNMWRGLLRDTSCNNSLKCVRNN
jgi:hypothetical protein